MRHLVPVSRWYGWGFGYCVAEATALTMVYQVGGAHLVPPIAAMLNSVLALAAVYALAITGWRLLRARMRSDGVASEVAARRAATGRREAPLGKYANSDSQTPQRAAGLTSELHPDLIEAIRATQPGAGSIAAEARLRS